MLATGTVVSAATSFRIGAANARLLAGRAPTLVRLAATASTGRERAGTAQAAFRDELLGLVSDASELSWRELRRGVDELDWLTRADASVDEMPHRRPYRVKP